MLMGRVLGKLTRGPAGNPSDTLTIQFTPRPNGPDVRNQSASWTLIDATGTFVGLTGGGTMFARGTPGTPRGHEIFTGTLR
jgi:hypothetical protein